MGHYNYNHHEDLLGDLVSSESDSSSDEEEDVWNPLMDFQEGEPVGDLNILMLPKVEQEEDGTVSVTVSDTFERFYLMIYIGMCTHDYLRNERDIIRANLCFNTGYYFSTVCRTRDSNQRNCGPAAPDLPGEHKWPPGGRGDRKH